MKFSLALLALVSATASVIPSTTGRAVSTYHSNKPEVSPGTSAQLADQVPPSESSTETTPQPSAAPGALTGVVRVVDVNSKTELGYVYLSSLPSAIGLYNISTDRTNAVKVSFTPPPDGSPFDVTTTGGTVNFNILGGITGAFNRDPKGDLASGFHNYAYIGGVSQVPPQSPALNSPNSFTEATGIPAGVESAIWSYNPNALQLTPQWINSDSSKPSTHLLYSPADGDMVLTGDVVTYRSLFSNAPAPEIAFYLAPA